MWSAIGAERLRAIAGEAESADDLCAAVIDAAWGGGGLASLGAVAVAVTPRQLPVGGRPRTGPERDAAS